MRALRRLDVWLLAPAPAARLAILRVLVGSFAVGYFAVAAPEFARLANRAAGFDPVGLATIINAPLSTVWLWGLYGATLAIGLFFVLGFGFRIVGPAFAIAVLFWASYHSSFGQLLHFEHLMVLHLLVVGFTPSAAACSIDATRSGDVHAVECSIRYGWPVRLAALITVATYVIAGVAKLRLTGWSWIDGDVLSNHIAYSAARLDLLGESPAPLARWLVDRAWLTAPMAAGAIALEFAAPIALFRSHWRRIWVVGVLAMHAGIALTMWVWFPYHLLGFGLLPLFDLERLSPRGGDSLWPNRVARRTIEAVT